MLRKTNVMAVVLLLALALVACGGKQAIIVDTTGLPPEQVALIEWKVKYAVALDWYDWQMKSLKASLDAMAAEDAKAAYREIGPLTGAVEASMQTFRAVVYSKDPDSARQAEAYQAFMRAKAQILAAILRLID